MKRSVTIPHLTGDDSNKLNQLTKWAQSLGHPVFYDNREGHITPMQILEMYDEAQSPSNPKPLVKIFYNSNESQHVRRNPSKPGKRKTAARDKYMANLLGGKNGNDLLNLASKVGSRKAAVTLLKSGNTKTPYNVEMPLGDEDEIQSLRMQGLTPSLDALVDEGFRSKLEKTIKGYLGENIEIKDVDKGVLITDESIEDFRQMLTVYHLAHQMNGPLANAIKGHVPRKDADLFDRLIPTFDDILAGENLVLFAHNIVQPPESNNTNFIVEDQDTLLPPWLSLAEPNDESLAELRSSLTQRDVETFMQILAGGDLRGAFNKALSVVRTQLQRPFLWVFGLRTLQQDDRQARLFDDLIENITDGLVSDYGRGRGYTDRKELAKAVMHSSSEVFDRRLTSAFAPLKITINAARRVRKFSRSGVNVRMLVDLNTVNAGDFDDRDPSVAQIEPGMYYLGNYDFRIPPIGWNRKWMNATAQIIHEYWNFITPNDEHSANDGFLSNRSNRNKSLTLPQLMYLIGIRTKELYNYDLPPEEWLVVLQVLGGKNALSKNYYTVPDDYAASLETLERTLEGELQIQREAVASIAGGRRARRISAKPHGKSALPQLAQGYNRKTMLTFKETIDKRAKTLEGMMKEFVDLREKTDKLRLAQTGKNVKFYDDLNKELQRKLKSAQKDTTTWQEKAGELQGHLKLLEFAGHKIVTIKETVEVEKSPKMSDLLGRKLMELFFESEKMAKLPSLIRLVNEYDIPGYTGQNAAPLRKLIMDYFKEEFKAHDPKALEFVTTIHKEVEEMAEEVIEDVESAIVDSSADKEIIELRKKADELVAELLAKPPSAPKADLSDLVSDPEELDASDDDDGSIYPVNYSSALNAPMKKPPKSYKAETKEFLESINFDELDDDFSVTYDDKGRPKISGDGLNNNNSSASKKLHKLPLAPRPTVYLGDSGKIVVLGDTHADYRANEKLLIHIESNYPDAKHVVWLGDTVDGGRGRMTGDMEYEPGRHDLRNLTLIRKLQIKDKTKYIALQGNHERFYLGMNTWGNAQQFPYWLNTIEQFGHDFALSIELNEFNIRPAIAVAGRTIMMHGQFPNQPLTLDIIRNEEQMTNAMLLNVLWNRKEIGEFGDDWKGKMLSGGFNTQIVAHTPSIAAANLRSTGEGNENGMFYDKDGLLGASLQSNCGTNHDPNEDYEYFVLDLDKDTLTIEVFERDGNYKKQLVQKTPPQKSVDIARRNPMNCGCGQTPCKTYGTRRNPTIPMYVGTPTGRVKNLGSITAIVQVGRNIIKDVGEGIQDIYRSLIGGRQSMTEKRMAMAVAEMQADLERECLELGGNVVGNIQIDYEYPATGSDITLIAVADAFKTPKKNPASNYHKYEKKVISILKKEGGAAGLKALKPAFPKGTTKAKVVGMLQKMNHVVLHQDGDYILIQGISNPPFDMTKEFKGKTFEEKLNAWASMHIDPIYEGGLTGFDDSHTRLFPPNFLKPDIYEYSPLYGTQKALFATADMKKSPGTSIRFFHTNNVNTEGSAIIHSLLLIAKHGDTPRPDLHLTSEDRERLEQELKKQYNAQSVHVGFFRHPKIKEQMTLILRFHQNYPKPKPKKNHPELMCIYKKSSRSKPCGTPLREKKNPKGRYACRKCGAEYEMK